MKANKKTKTKKAERKQFEEELVLEVKQDFLSRQAMRAPLERQWQLNMDFIAGRQYKYLSKRGEILDEDKNFFWQSRLVFNHVAPVIESRLAKLGRINPVMAVKPTNDDDREITNAFLAEKILSDVFEKLEMKKVVKQATTWSEVTGTAFYKVIWNSDSGSAVGELNGKTVYDGEVEILPVSPFEIFPDNLNAENLFDCQSLIHAKAVSVDKIKQIYGVTVEPEEVTFAEFSGTESDSKNLKMAIVIEKYERPSETYPNGRLITIAGDTLLFYGELPYKNGEDGVREYPFIRQQSLKSAGCFFGQSVVERLIPVQRAYNAVKNRKHEFLSRLSSGVLAVEDGSIDTDDLEIDGLCPGKVLVYRQGSTKPEMLKEGDIPKEFSDEEENLLAEFVSISGVSEVSSSSKNAGFTSGSALTLLIEQDNEKLTVPAEEIREVYRLAGKFILRLYKEFLVGAKVIEDKGEDYRTKIYYVDKKTLTSDKVYVANENELLYTENQKKEMLFKLYESGILADADGQIKTELKEKMLALMGYKDLTAERGLTGLQRQKAVGENIKIINMDIPVEIIDEHKIHIEEHTRYALSEYEKLTEKQKQNIFGHIEKHQKKLQNKNVVTE